MKRPTPHTPPKSFHDILLPCSGDTPKYDAVSAAQQRRLEFLDLAEKLYDEWYCDLPPKLKKAEYEIFMLDSNFRPKRRSRVKLQSDKAERLEYILKIEKLKQEGKLRWDYRAK